jgi:biopolymer transport protein ExbD
MGLPSPSRAGKLDADPNVLPMIDVLLVMIVIFMLLLKVRMAIPVQVPPVPEADRPAPEATQIVLEVLSAGGFRLNGQPVPDEELDALLTTVYANRTRRLLFIKASPELSYQDVVRAMDRARGAGVAVVALMPGGPAASPSPR